MRKCPPDPGRGGQGTAAILRISATRAGGFEESGPSIPPGAEKLLGVLFDSDREIQVPGDPVRSGGALLSETEAGGAMATIVGIVFPIFALIGLGYLGRRLHLLTGDAAVALSGYVYYFSLPALLYVKVAEVPVAS